MPKFIKSPLNLFFVVLALVFLYSCGLWSDFTTYFNTYYNASQIFEEVEKELEKEETKMFTFGEKTAPRSVMDRLKKVLEKTSKIMQFDTASSYFDDALLMTGKAFFYQGRYSKASRKFRELSALKNTDLQLESRLWIGKTELQLRNFERGLEILENVETEALANDRSNMVTEALISQISFLVYRERFDEAVASAEKLLKITEDEELKANIAFEIGNFYLQLENFEEAKKAFRNVKNYSPSFLIEYKSQLEYARIQRGVGEYDSGLTELQELRSEAKYKEFYPEIEYEMGMIHYDQSNFDEAFKKFKEVDSLYSKSKVIGQADYKIAQIFENQYMKYDSADYYYGLVLKSEVPQDIRNDALARTKIFDKYTGYHKELETRAQKYLYATDSSAFIEDSLAYVEYMEDKRAQEALSYEDSDTTQTDTTQADTTQTALQDKEELEQEEDKRVVRRGEDREQDENTEGKADPQKSEDEDAIEKPVYPALPADSLSAQIGRTSYKLGNLFFTEINVTDSAEFYYKKSLDHNLTPNMRSKVVFALGNVYEVQENQKKADSLFNYVYQNYKSFEIVNEAAKKLGKEEVVMRTDKAQNRYLAAEENLWSENYDSAIVQLYSIYNKYPNSTYAPKALYTIGYIYENNLNKLDSAAVVYDTLNSKYTNTKYARTVRPKIDAFKQEQQRIQAVQDSIARADSIAKLPKSESDSTKAAASDSLKTESGNEDEQKLDAEGKKKKPKPDNTEDKDPKSSSSQAIKEKKINNEKPEGGRSPEKTDSTKTEEDKKPSSG